MKSGAVLLLAALLGGAVVSVAVGGEEAVLFEERFGERLGDGWSWVREDADGWKLDKGALVVRASTGGLWQKDNNTRNILLRKPPKTKDNHYAVEVYVENEPTNAFEHAGLVWYCDDDNYAILVKEKVGDKVIVQLVNEKEGRPKVGFAEKPFPGKGVWLQLEVAGTKAVGRYRATDRDEWQKLGECDLPLKGEPRVGLLTGYAPKNAEHAARFSGFRVVQPGAK
jgi:regulation of enolase protein 1 (concanavalin A-like superfamily)